MISTGDTVQKRGLTSKAAVMNLQKWGRNELQDLLHVSAFKILLNQVKKNAIVYMFSAAMFFSFLVGKVITGYTILAVLIIVISVSFIQEYKAEKAIKALRSMITPKTQAYRDGRVVEVESALLVPGDVIFLRSGEKIPADGIILKDNDLHVNEAVLKGK